MYKIQLNDRIVHYRIRESKRARYINLVMNFQTGLELVVPAGVDVSNHQDLLRQREDWILKQLDRFDTLPAPRQYVTGEELLYLGESYTLVVQPNVHKSRSTVRRDGSAIIVKLPQALAETEQSDASRDALENWYRREARRYITARTEALAAQHGLRYQNIAIRGQKTRWASCSTHGNLNFNYKLIMALPGAIDYVIIHELAHLREMNHSRRYWQLVENMCPDYKYWRKWLKDNSARLDL